MWKEFTQMAEEQYENLSEQLEIEKYFTILQKR